MNFFTKENEMIISWIVLFSVMLSQINMCEGNIGYNTFGGPDDSYEYTNRIEQPSRYNMNPSNPKREFVYIKRGLLTSLVAVRRASSRCSSDNHVRYLCEMCAKETKSLYVFTTCCQPGSSTLRWCENLHSFGLH